MTEIYSAVEERLTAQVPELLYIDLESGQLEGQTPPPVDFPCALVDVRFNKCEDQSAKVQQCEVNRHGSRGDRGMDRRDVQCHAEAVETKGPRKNAVAGQSILRPSRVGDGFVQQPVP